MIARLFGKAIPNRHVFLSLAGMARKLRKQSPMMNPLVEEVSPQQRRELDKEKIEELRENKIMSVKPRRVREPEEDLENQIGKLIDTGKSDAEILAILRKKQEEKESGPTPEMEETANKQVSAKMSKLAEKQMDHFFTDMEKVNEKELMINQQKLLVKEMMQQVNMKPTKINSKAYQKSQIEDQLAKEFLKRERVLEIMSKRKDPSEFKAITQDDINQYLVPQSIRQKALEYKDTQMKYFTELIRDNQPDTGHMLHRRSTKRDNQDQQQQGYLKSILEKTTAPLEKAPYPVVPETYEVKTNRLTKQYEQVQAPSPADVEFQKKGAQDLQQTTEQNNSIFLDQNQQKVLKKINKEESPITKFKKLTSLRLKQFEQKGLEIDIEDITQMEKQNLFFQKQFLQQQQKFNERLTRRQKLKEIKRIKTQMNRQQFEDTVDYKVAEEIEGYKAKKFKNVYGVPDEQKINALNEKYARAAFGAKKEEWDHNYFRTIENMENWLYHQLHSPQTINKALHSIVIDRVEPNDALTVLKVVWRIRPQFFEEQADHAKFFQDKRQQFKNKIEAQHMQKIKDSLLKITKVLSSKMCQELGLRQGPDIRFVYYKQSEEISNAKKKLEMQMPQIIKQKIQAEVEKGNIAPKVSVKQFEFLLSDLEHQFESNINKLGDNEDPLRKQKSKKKDKNKARQNRTEDGKRKKYERKGSASEKFWSKL